MRRQWIAVPVLLCLVACGAEPAPEAAQNAPAPVDPAKAQYDAAMQATSDALEADDRHSGEMLSSSWESGRGPNVDFGKVFKSPGSSIVVNCAVKDGEAQSSIAFKLGDWQAAGPVKLFFDGEKSASRTLELDEQGLFQTGCHSCSTTFHAVINDFRTRRMVEVVAADDKREKFGLHAADTAIPTDCRSTRDLEFQ